MSAADIRRTSEFEGQRADIIYQHPADIRYTPDK